MLTTGDPSPTLPTGAPEAPVVLVFFKVTCPTCVLAAPKMQAIADAGVPVVAVGQDPPERLAAFAADHDLSVEVISDPPPYALSDAFGIEHVPTVYALDAGGRVAAAAAGWDREGWNRVAVAAGGPAVSADGDGWPAFRPG